MLLFFGLFVCCYTYLPIIYVHGLGSAGWLDWFSVGGMLHKYHPGQKAYPLNTDDLWLSYRSMEKQVEDAYAKIKEIQKEHNVTDFIMMAHSQGNLIARALLQKHGELKADRFICVAGMMLGQFGVPSVTFPEWMRNMTLSALTDVLYTKIFQENFGIANYWNDPLNHKKYLEDNLFLPKLNYPSPQDRLNFLQLKNFYLFGSKDDGIVVPWESEMFGFYKLGEEVDITPMLEQDVYIKDTFGIKTMNEDGRLHLTHVPGIGHNNWFEHDYFVKYFLPLLK